MYCDEDTSTGSAGLAHHRQHALSWTSSCSLGGSLHDLSTSGEAAAPSGLLGAGVLRRYRSSRFCLAARHWRRQKVKGSAMLWAALNCTNSILGAGLMGIPYAVAQAGLIPGCAILVLVAVLSDWSVNMLIRSGRMVGAGSYQEMMHRAFGPVGAGLSAAFQVVFAFGCMCAYLVIIADNLTRVIGHYLPASVLRQRQLLILAGNALILCPLSMARNVTFLGGAASLSVGGNLLIVLAVALQRGQEALAGSYRLFGGGLVRSVTVVSFSFVCHHNTFLIRESIESKSARVFSVVTTVSVAFSLLVSLLLSVPAYLHFGQATNGTPDSAAHAPDPR